MGRCAADQGSRPDLRRVCYRAYNDWLAEFCATAPARFVGAGLIPIDDPKEAADEVRYLKQIGLRTGMFLAARVERALWDEGWEPLWEAGAETGLPIGFHLGGGLRTTVDSGPKATTAGNIGVRVACATLQMDEPLAAVNNACSQRGVRARKGSPRMSTSTSVFSNPLKESLSDRYTFSIRLAGRHGYMAITFIC
jgi:amidohydrolase family protein